MKIFLLFAGVFFGLLGISLTLEAKPSSALSHSFKLPYRSIKPFIQKHCIRCHGAKKQKGQVRFDKETWVIKNNDDAQRWQDVLDVLNGGEMPPEEEKQPSKKELITMLSTLTKVSKVARQRLTSSGGEVKMRRLNKREYSQTIHHLFGFEVDQFEIPSDGEILTFDTVGEEQFYTSAHFNRYLVLGRKVVKKAFSINTRPYLNPSNTRVHPEKQLNHNLRKQLAENDRKKAMKDKGMSWKEMGFKDEGQMKILFRQWKSRVELPRRYLQYSKVDEGAYNSAVAKWFTVSKHVDIRGEYIARVHGGVVGKPHPLRRIIKLSSNAKIHGTLEMKGTPEQPETVSMKLRHYLGTDGRLMVRVQENYVQSNNGMQRGYMQSIGANSRDRTYPNASIYVDWLEVEGPFYPEQRPAFEDLLFPGMETGSRSSPYLNKDSKARELIEKFASLAFRENMPNEEYVEALVANYKEQRKSGVKYTQAMTEVMAIILSSPSFLFIQESMPEQSEPHDSLTSQELAVRLAYFLWSSPPDDLLVANDLTNPAIYAAEVDRMIVNAKIKGFRDGFITQWAELDRYDAITVDRKEHYHFNQGVQQDAKQEVKEFFGCLIDENLPVENIIDSDFVVVNGALANHYGIPSELLDGGGFQKVTLPSESPRGGMITQTAFLTSGSNGERSSPVIRGAMVLDKILHDPPSPPPPNVPELDEASDKPMTNKQMVLMHQERASCASCHKKMDVIGFGLENFDTSGRWRDSEKVGRNKVVIDPAGVLPSGEKFQNVAELKQLLLESREALARELVESILSYALGRTIEFSDADDVDAIMAKLKKNNYRTRDLIREVALSPIFKYR